MMGGHQLVEAKTMGAANVSRINHATIGEKNENTYT